MVSNLRAVEQQKCALKPKLVRKIGIALFILSFVVPPRCDSGFDFHQGGYGTFIGAPGLGWEMITGQVTWGGGAVYSAFDALVAVAPWTRKFAVVFSGLPARFNIFEGVLVLAAWITNFTVFFKLPASVSWAAIVVPWIAYACFFQILVGYIPFYFWALGIGLIHISRLYDSTHKIPLETKATAH